MALLHRHQIAWLSSDAWQRLLPLDWDDEARACLGCWADHGLPVVVTRQPAGGGDGGISVGLCAPRRWGHRRLALRVQPAEVLYFDEFPRLDRVLAQLPPSARAPARALALALQASGTAARVYGSHGWQQLTGLDHVREGSDLDVWVAVAGPGQADAAAAAMEAFAAPSRRLDGELVFDGDAAVAWREWLAWRRGQVRSLLVKRLHGASVPAHFLPSAAMEVTA